MECTNGNGRLAARDRIIYRIIAAFLGVLGFLAMNMYLRMSTIELLLQGITTANVLHEQRFLEDHTLLANIEASRQQRTTSVRQLEERVDRLELQLFHVPAVKGAER